MVSAKVMRTRWNPPSGLLYLREVLSFLQGSHAAAQHHLRIWTLGDHKSFRDLKAPVFRLHHQVHVNGLATHVDLHHLHGGEVGTGQGYQQHETFFHPTHVAILVTVLQDS